MTAPAQPCNHTEAEQFLCNIGLCPDMAEPHTVAPPPSFVFWTRVYDVIEWLWHRTYRHFLAPRKGEHPRSPYRHAKHLAFTRYQVPDYQWHYLEYVDRECQRCPEPPPCNE